MPAAMPSATAEELNKGWLKSAKIAARLTMPPAPVLKNCTTSLPDNIKLLILRKFIKTILNLVLI